jgi:hypothetical protein
MNDDPLNDDSLGEDSLNDDAPTTNEEEGSGPPE